MLVSVNTNGFFALENFQGLLMFANTCMGGEHFHTLEYFQGLLVFAIHTWMLRTVPCLRIILRFISVRGYFHALEKILKVFTCWQTLLCG